MCEESGYSHIVFTFVHFLMECGLKVEMIMWVVC
jgi:hypothetical protein